MPEISKQKAQQGRQLKPTEDSELSAVDLLFPHNAYLKPDAHQSQRKQCISAQAASNLYICAIEASKQVKRKRSTHTAIITELVASRQVKRKQSTHAAMITELEAASKQV